MTRRDLTTIRALSSTSLRTGRGAKSRTGKERLRHGLGVQLWMTHASADRLLRALARGRTSFALSAIDGSITIRVQVSAAPWEAPSEWRMADDRRVTINWAEGVMAHGRNRVALSRTELRIVGALVESGGTPISRAALASQVWSAANAELERRAAALPVYICSLRKRLRSLGLGDILETVRGAGYRLNFVSSCEADQFTDLG